MRVANDLPYPRALVLLSSIALAAVAVAGCTPQPKPTPSPEAVFASDEEAFAAAEDVYRAYNEAGNSRISGRTVPDPQDYLTGAALEADILGQNVLADQGLHLVGESTVRSFKGEDVSISGTTTTISAVVCLDVSHTRVLDESEEDVTPDTRPDVVGQLVGFATRSGQLMIASEASAKDGSC